ncbi:MAG: NOB1 family endonuclease [Bacillota bacterium]
MTNMVDCIGRRVVVLDTSAFVAGYDPFSLGEKQVTVPKVEEEIRRNSMIKMRLEMAIESGRLNIKAPTEEFQVKAEAFGNKVGDSFKLSETDKQLLALALELKASGYIPQLVTDDYSIQNVAIKMGIGFLPLATLGIKRHIEWIRYCPACYKEYSAEERFKECQICGTELKRKAKRQKKESNR